jgi:hypothetical protein
LPDSSKRVLLAPVEQAVTEKDQDGIIPRMAAAQRLREIHNKRTAQILAVKYQLISSWTHYLAIVVRNEDEKADTLPELQKVEQMLAAGWGGFGNVTSGRNSLSLGLVSPIFPCAGANLHGHKNYALMRSHCSPQGLGIGYTDYQKPDEPTFFQKSCNFAKASIENFRPKAPPAVLPVDGWIWEYGYEHLMNRFIIMLDKKLNLGSIAAIIEIPLLPSGIATALSQLVVQGIDERIVVAHFLYHLSESSVGNNLSRQAKRVIGKAYKKLHIDSQVAETIRTRLRI